MLISFADTDFLRKQLKAFFRKHVCVSITGVVMQTVREIKFQNSDWKNRYFQSNR